MKKVRSRISMVRDLEYYQMNYDHYKHWYEKTGRTGAKNHMDYWGRAIEITKENIKAWDEGRRDIYTKW